MYFCVGFGDIICCRGTYFLKVFIKLFSYFRPISDILIINVEGLENLTCYFVCQLLPLNLTMFLSYYSYLVQVCLDNFHGSFQFAINIYVTFVMSDIFVI